MNRIILIGNGFDLAHGLKTKYTDFIDDFWDKKLNIFLKILHDRSLGVIRKNDNVSQKPDCYNYNDNDISIDFLNFFGNQSVPLSIPRKLSGFDNFIFEISRFRIKSYENNYKFNNTFLGKITYTKQIEKWVDIEEEYYTALLDCLNDIEKVKKLNNDFHSLQISLENYLIEQSKTAIRQDHQIAQRINSPFSHPLYTDKQNSKIDNFLFLNFNYTDTEKLYVSPVDKIIHIHGELNKSGNPIIFGYGDEIGDKYKLLEDKNKNNYLDNIKSIKYLETRNYIELLGFIDLDEYEIFIMGHSCGISDRTLLNTLFEHKNCLSIKVFFHKLNSDLDNYSDVVRNISRNFTDKLLMRKKVINKKDSSPLIYSTGNNI